MLLTHAEAGRSKDPEHKSDRDIFFGDNDPFLRGIRSVSIISLFNQVIDQISISTTKVEYEFAWIFIEHRE